MSIVVEDFHKIYDQAVAVSGLSFEVGPGEILGLVGPNGAGKTTTMRALAGILEPTQRAARDRRPRPEARPRAAKSALAYVPDDPHLFDNLTIWEHFQFIAAAYRLKDWSASAETLLAQFELVEKRDVALLGPLARDAAEGRDLLRLPPRAEGDHARRAADRASTPGASGRCRSRSGAGPRRARR